jgi:hypothetical protein
MLKKRPKIIFRVQLWALLLVFFGTWALASPHSHDETAEDHTSCTTCHFQHQLSSSNLSPASFFALPQQWIESLPTGPSDFHPSLAIFITQDSQAPPQS